MKSCSRCYLEKDLTEYHVDNRSKDGRRIVCKTCIKKHDQLYYQNNLEKKRMQATEYRKSERGRRVRKEHYQKNKEAKRLYCIEKTYGLNSEDYTQMLNKQNGQCLICNDSENNGRNLCVDHCHNTGRVRGLLCDKCNLSIGLLRDDAIRVKKLFEYLKGES